MSGPLPFRKIYGMPFILAGVTACGLLAALIGDGLWDAASWVALTLPLAVLVFCFFRGRHSGGAMSR